MPPNKENCESCGKLEMACPECGEATVSIDSLHMGDYPPGGGGHLSPDFRQFGIYSEEDDVLRYKAVCWNCPWEETRELSVEIG